MSSSEQDSIDLADLARGSYAILGRASALRVRQTSTKTRQPAAVSGCAHTATLPLEPRGISTPSSVPSLDGESRVSSSKLSESAKTTRAVAAVLPRPRARRLRDEDFPSSALLPEDEDPGKPYDGAYGFQGATLGPAAHLALKAQAAHFDRVCSSLREAAAEQARRADTVESNTISHLRQLLAAREAAFLDLETARSARLQELTHALDVERHRRADLANEVAMLQAQLTCLESRVHAEHEVLAAAIDECEAETARLYIAPVIPPPAGQPAWDQPSATTSPSASRVMSTRAPSGALERAQVEQLHALVRLHMQQSELEGVPVGRTAVSALVPAALLAGPLRVVPKLRRENPAGLGPTATTPRDSASPPSTSSLASQGLSAWTKSFRSRPREGKAAAAATSGDVVTRVCAQSVGGSTGPVAEGVPTTTTSRSDATIEHTIGPTALPDGTAVLNEGWCLKRSKWLRAWRHRWLVLTADRRLITFKEPLVCRDGARLPPATSTVHIDAATTVETLSVATHGSALAGAPSELVASAAFGVHAGAGEPVVFAALNMSERDMWIEAITRCCSHPAAAREAADESASDSEADADGKRSGPSTPTPPRHAAFDDRELVGGTLAELLAATPEIASEAWASRAACAPSTEESTADAIACPASPASRRAAWNAILQAVRPVALGLPKRLLGVSPSPPSEAPCAHCPCCARAAGASPLSPGPAPLRSLLARARRGVRPGGTPLARRGSRGQPLPLARSARRGARGRARLARGRRQHRRSRRRRP